MRKLHFLTTNLEKVAVGIEGFLRHELGVSTPIPYEITKAADSKLDSPLVAFTKFTAANAVNQLASRAVGQIAGGFASHGSNLAIRILAKKTGSAAQRMLVGGMINKVIEKDIQLVGTISFTLSLPGRQGEIQADILRKSVTTFLGPLLFITHLENTFLDADVLFERSADKSIVRFIGDSAACAKLNTNRLVLQRVSTFTRSECFLTSLAHFSIQPSFQIIAHTPEPRLAAFTTAAPSGFLGSLRIDVNEFFAIAEQIGLELCRAPTVGK